MALPKQTAPKYKVILPSDGKEIEYRPFLVQEQKALLIAQEQEDDDKDIGERCIEIAFQFPSEYCPGC